MCQSAPDMADEQISKPEDTFGHSPGIHDFTGEHEERDRQQGDTT